MRTAHHATSVACQIMSSLVFVKSLKGEHIFAPVRGTQRSTIQYLLASSHYSRCNFPSSLLSLIGEVLLQTAPSRCLVCLITSRSVSVAVSLRARSTTAKKSRSVEQRVLVGMVLRCKGAGLADNNFCAGWVHGWSDWTGVCRTVSNVSRASCTATVYCMYCLSLPLLLYSN